MCVRSPCFPREFCLFELITLFWLLFAALTPVRSSLVWCHLRWLSLTPLMQSRAKTTRMQLLLLPLLPLLPLQQLLLQQLLK